MKKKIRLLPPDRVGERWTADRTPRVPPMSIAWHLDSGRLYDAGSRIPRAARRGEVWVMRQAFSLHLRNLELVVTPPSASPTAVVLWCSLDLEVVDIAQAADHFAPRESPLTFDHLTAEVNKAMTSDLGSLGRYDLDTAQGRESAQRRILEDLTAPPGLRILRATIRKAVKGESHLEERRALLEFRRGLERLLNDSSIADAAEWARMEKALRAIESDRAAPLLTEKERRLSAPDRALRYLDVLGSSATEKAGRRHPCPHPHCTTDLSVGQTFACQRCGNTLHAWHRSPAKPRLCEDCGRLTRSTLLLVGAGLMTLLVLLGLLFLGSTSENPAGGPEEAYADRYVSVDIPGNPEGPFYNPDRYDLELGLENRRDILTLVSRITVEFHSERVRRRVEALRLRPGEPYYVAVVEGLPPLLPRQETEIPLRGPVFLPERAEVTLVHSGSKEPSRFSIPLAAGEEPLREPLGPLQVSPDILGADGLQAISRAVSVLGVGTEIRQLISCIPADEEKRILPNGLYVTRVRKWLVTFETAGGEGVSATTDGRTADTEGPFDISGLRDLGPRMDVARIRVGSFAVTERALGEGLVWGNAGHGLALLRGRDGLGQATYVWRLPYVGSDFLNLFMDATSGEVLPSRDLYDLCPFERASTSRPATQGR